MELDTKIIKIKIIEKGYTQKEIAKKIGVTEQTLINWINGQIGNNKKFIELLNFLNITIDELKKKD